MNETTRAILRRELEAKKRDLSEISRDLERHTTTMQCIEDEMHRTKAEIADLNAALVQPAVMPNQIGAVDLTHGERLHIHNG